MYNVHSGLTRSPWHGQTARHFAVEWNNAFCYLEAVSNNGLIISFYSKTWIDCFRDVPYHVFIFHLDVYPNRCLDQQRCGDYKLEALHRYEEQGLKNWVPKYNTIIKPHECRFWGSRKTRVMVFGPGNPRPQVEGFSRPKSITLSDKLCTEGNISVYILKWFWQGIFAPFANSEFVRWKSLISGMG
jgi:hypothetical protein